MDNCLAGHIPLDVQRMTTWGRSGALPVLRCRISCVWNGMLSTAQLPTDFHPHLYNELRAAYPHTLCTDHWSAFLDKTLILGALWATCMWISGRLAATMAACFCLTGFQLRGYPCQWNFGSSAWSFCAMSCLPSNSTPGSVRYRSKPKATSCVSTHPNRFVLDWVNEKYLSRVLELLDEHGNGLAPVLSLLIGSKRSSAPRAAPNAPLAASASQAQAAAAPLITRLLPLPRRLPNRRHRRRTD